MDEKVRDWVRITHRKGAKLEKGVSFGKKFYGIGQNCQWKRYIRFEKNLFNDQGKIYYIAMYCNEQKGERLGKD